MKNAVRLFTLFFTLLMVAACTLVFVPSCGAVHTHDFSLEVVSDDYCESEATCTLPATYYYSCSCGTKGTETFTYGDALEHSWGDIQYIGKSPTCSKDGYAYYKCTVCGTESDPIIIIANEHEWHYDGVCDNCGASCSHDSYTDGVCDDCWMLFDVMNGACEHEWVNQPYIAPTCTTDGMTEGDTCSVCGKTTYEVIPATGHTVGDVVEQHGDHAHAICSTCGDSVDVCTCADNSFTDGVCDVCGNICSHSYSDRTDGTCTNCGYVCEHSNWNLLGTSK